MDLQPHFDQKSTILPTISGPLFPPANGFTINGGTFTSNIKNNVYNPPSEEPSAFRTILLGDLDLMKEIHLDNESGIVGRQKRGGGFRRIYTAKIMGNESRTMTVAVYQGNGAEEASTHYETVSQPFQTFPDLDLVHLCLLSLLPTAMNPKNVADGGNARWQFGGDGRKGKATRSRFCCGIKRVAELGCSRHTSFDIEDIFS
ncbi:hypothetical protein B0H14DRAFT_2633044 [Mycena olivaceomarginata]|nr:hypothetical protein B0H14DRAFT_2633044 [Mycena olivaceomarginata]